MAKIPEEWSRHLTPERRELFEGMGRESVQSDLDNRKFGPPEDIWGAQAWLAEQRQADQRRDTGRFAAVIIIGILTLIAAVAGVVVTKGWL